MKIYKRVDVVIQACLLLGALATILTQAYDLFFWFLFGLGATQLISMVVHIFNSPLLRVKWARVLYYVFLGIAAIVAWLIFVADVGNDIDWLFYFLFYTLAMGLYYFCVCTSEWKHKTV